MATTMEGSFTVPADKQTVWNGLNDAVVLRHCVGGVHSLEKTSPTEFAVLAKVKIGPLSASFRGRIELRDVDEPNSCRLFGEGAGGLAGFAKGTADVRLTEVPEGTTVTYAVEADVGGRLARIGGRFIDGVAKRLADRFFTAFAAMLATEQAAQ